jgi:hypothetical protein
MKDDLAIQRYRRLDDALKAHSTIEVLWNQSGKVPEALGRFPFTAQFCEYYFSIRECSRLSLQMGIPSFSPSEFKKNRFRIGLYQLTDEILIDENSHEVEVVDSDAMTRFCNLEEFILWYLNDLAVGLPREAR